MFIIGSDVGGADKSVISVFKVVDGVATLISTVVEDTAKPKPTIEELKKDFNLFMKHYPIRKEDFYNMPAQECQCTGFRRTVTDGGGTIVCDKCKLPVRNQ